jgi:hypothetical protein
VGGVGWGGVRNVKWGIHFGGRFCQVRSRNCVFNSSLKWSKAVGPVPVHDQYRTEWAMVANILPPFFGSMSGNLLILR